MMNFISPTNVYGLPPDEYARLLRLVQVFLAHQGANETKNRYYEGKISLASVNLGIALPQGMQGLEIDCAWGAKCVDVLAGRSIFDGFVGTNGEEVPELDALVRANRLIAEYDDAAKDELKFGCTFATLSRDPAIGCKIRFHSPRTAAAIWNGDKGRVDCGFAIIDTAPANDNTWSPSLVYYYTDEAVWVLQRTDTLWSADWYPHRMGRPLIEPLIWNSTSDKPFGRSRIKAPERRLIEGYVRTIADAAIGLEFATSPQKYLLGVTDEQYEAVTSDKFRQYVGAIIAATQNPETGEKPSFGQLAQGTLGPHIDMIRMLATQFSAATGLPITDVGVVNDANPTSAEAIEAQTKTLVGLAEKLNQKNGDNLLTIALMALAVANDTTVEELSDAQKNVVARFKNPAMPSVAATADAAVKIAGVRPSFAQTDTFLEMIGFSQADIRRIRAQELRVRGMALVDELA